MLVLAPMPSEMRPVVRLLGLRRQGEQGGIAVYEGRAGSAIVVLTGTGIGPELARAATERMVDGSRFDLVLVCGIAGGLAPATRVGDLVVPEAAVDGATGERFEATPPAGVPAAGVVWLTSGAGDYELDDARVAELVGQGFVAVDMETAAIARVCAGRSIPWAAFRAISDLAGDDGVGADVLGLVDELGRPRIGRSLRFLLGHPHHIRVLARLGKDARRAAQRAAGAAVAAIEELPAR